MVSTASHIVSFMGVISMVCLLIGVILLMHLIQSAFSREGVIWGLISVLYPPGTYLFCRRNWENYRSQYIVTNSLIMIALVLWLIVKYV